MNTMLVNYCDYFTSTYNDTLAYNLLKGNPYFMNEAGEVKPSGNQYIVSRLKNINIPPMMVAAYITKYTADYGTYGNTVPMAIDSSGSVKLSGSMNVASLLVGSIKGPYSNDSAASSGGVPIKGVYYDSSGIIHVRLT